MKTKVTDELERIEQVIGDEEARQSPAVKNAKCTVCHEAWVDVMNGEDTCPECLKNQ